MRPNPGPFKQQQQSLVQNAPWPIRAIAPEFIPNPAFVIMSKSLGVILNKPFPLIRTPTDVIVRIYSRQFSASDLHLWRNCPVDGLGGFVPGMHASGIVHLAGPASTLRAGTRVVFTPILPCRTCVFCKSGNVNLCPQRSILGNPPWDGTLCKYCVVPETACIVLPEKFTFDEGTLIGSYALAVHVCRRAGIGPGDKVVVFGQNHCGDMCADVSRAFGATQVLVLGKDEMFTQPLEEGQTMKERAKDIAAQIWVEKELENGANVVLECSGSLLLMHVGVHVLRKGGTYCQLFGDDLLNERPRTFPFREAFRNEIVMRTSVGCTPEDFRVAVEMLMGGQIRMRAIRGVYEFDDSQRAFAEAAGMCDAAGSVFEAADPEFFINGPKGS